MYYIPCLLYQFPPLITYAIIMMMNDFLSVAGSNNIFDNKLAPGIFKELGSESETILSHFADMNFLHNNTNNQILSQKSFLADSMFLNSKSMHTDGRLKDKKRKKRKRDKNRILIRRSKSKGQYKAIRDASDSYSNGGFVYRNDLSFIPIKNKRRNIKKTIPFHNSVTEEENPSHFHKNNVLKVKDNHKPTHNIGLSRKEGWIDYFQNRSLNSPQRESDSLYYHYEVDTEKLDGSNKDKINNENGGLNSVPSSYAASRTKRPNIILMLTDDQDVELGSLNFMPILKSVFEGGGAKFSNAYVTTPVCCPSRSSILTGIYAHNHNVLTNNMNCSSLQWQMTHEPRTFANYLQMEAGYKTGYFGKYLNEYNGSYIPPGWEEWSGLVRNTRYYNYTINHNGIKIKHGDIYEEDYFSDLIINDSLAFLRGSKYAHPKSPLLMVLSMPAPHGTEDSAPQYNHMFKNATSHRTPSWNYAPNMDKEWILQRTGKMEPIHIAFTDMLNQKRLQTLQSVDEGIMRLYHELDSMNELDNTYWIYSSDHGYHLGQYGLIKGKSLPYEFDIKVPLFIRGPGIKSHIEIKKIALNIDIAPTILDMAGIGVKEHMDGKSLLQLLKKEDQINAKNDRIWGDTFLIERGKITEKLLKRIQDEQSGFSVQNQNGDLGRITKSQWIREECLKPENSSPCKKDQKWFCKRDSNPYPYKWRMVKCRHYGLMIKDQCMCIPSKFNDGVPQKEKLRQKKFLKKYANQKFQPHFMNRQIHALDNDLKEIYPSDPSSQSSIDQDNFEGFSNKGDQDRDNFRQDETYDQSHLSKEEKENNEGIGYYGSEYKYVDGTSSNSVSLDKSSFGSYHGSNEITIMRSDHDLSGRTNTNSYSRDAVDLNEGKSNLDGNHYHRLKKNQPQFDPRKLGERYSKMDFKNSSLKNLLKLEHREKCLQNLKKRNKHRKKRKKRNIKKCRMTENNTVICEYSVYSLYLWDRHKEDIRDQIKAYKACLKELKDIRNFLKKHQNSLKFRSERSESFPFPNASVVTDNRIISPLYSAKSEKKEKDNHNLNYEICACPQYVGHYNGISGNDEEVQSSYDHYEDTIGELSSDRPYIIDSYDAQARNEKPIGIVEGLEIHGQTVNNLYNVAGEDDYSVKTKRNALKHGAFIRTSKSLDSFKPKKTRQKRHRKKKHKDGKDKCCNEKMMNCFQHDNYHWKTPPFWTLGPFCFCQNANNQSFSCLRTINKTFNFLYCEFVTGFISYYDIENDPYQLKNIVAKLSLPKLLNLHNMLLKLKTCKGQECNVLFNQK
ncbi:unnamed protein product [Gordionus sp. m RMFG-2023]